MIRTVLCALALSTGAHGLAWEATIERDALGVPHILGETDADMAFGLAWALSEDGWEVLEETLPYYRGNAASFFGRDAAGTDYLVQWLGFWEVIDRDYDTLLKPETTTMKAATRGGVFLLYFLYSARDAGGPSGKRGMIRLLSER